MENNTFIGLDVHKASISVAVARGERGGEVRHWGITRNPQHDSAEKVVESFNLRHCSISRYSDH
ncbi:hypothetical protein [Paracoccus sp. J56]|uniref:hypothetical protein n=1 Tax=Paracoccus sp. J56 TaxID=935850 RepID=UPI000A0BA502|nr:hypothetical protein [Paracoccus sp. J56]SMG49950.1 hypothetical protein SAMN02746000_03089 [Paracoccus sp. J56]